MDMIMQWIYVAIYGSAILVVLIIAETLKRKFGVDISVTRKVVHFGVGILTICTPFVFKNSLPLISIAALFVVVNGISYYLDLFKGMSSRRKTIGTVIFPLSFLFLLLFAWDGHRYLIAYGIGLMTFADGLASVVGEKMKKPHTYQVLIDKKSIEGSTALFLTTIFITGLFIKFGWLGFPSHLYSTGIWLLIMVQMGFISVLLESISVYGSDNLSLPVLGSLFMLVFLSGNGILFFVILTFVIFLLLGIVAYYKKWLVLGGVFPMLLIAVTIVTFGHWKWLVLMVLFFITSSILSKQRDKAFFEKNDIEQKTSRRDGFQVIANGSVAVIVSVLYYFFPTTLVLVVYAAVIAAITADTWSTEIGYFSRKVPVSILTFTEVPKGSSGGVTLLGVIGGGLGALLIALAAMLLFPDKVTFPVMILIALAGLAGTLFDSILGSSVQVKYRCPECGAIVERKIHCTVASMYERGIHFIDNDWVNWLSSGFIALLCWIIFLFI